MHFRQADVSPSVSCELINSVAACRPLNGRLRDECLNEHWVTSLAHAREVNETWRREYNEERPKKKLGGQTPTQYAKQFAMLHRAVLLCLFSSVWGGHGARS